MSNTAFVDAMIKLSNDMHATAKYRNLTSDLGNKHNYETESSPAKTLQQWGADLDRLIATFLLENGQEVNNIPYRIVCTMQREKVRMQTRKNWNRYLLGLA